MFDDSNMSIMRHNNYTASDLLLFCKQQFRCKNVTESGLRHQFI